jgi:hypothetical protein
MPLVLTKDPRKIEIDAIGSCPRWRPGLLESGGSGRALCRGNGQRGGGAHLGLGGTGVGAAAVATDGSRSSQEGCGWGNKWFGELR